MNYPDEILDLNNFEMQERFTEAENTLQLKLYSIVNIKTGAKNTLKSSVKKLNDFNRRMLLNYSREIEISSKLKHPSILEFIGYSLTNFKSKPKALIVMDYSKCTLYRLFVAKRFDIDNDILFSKWDDTKKLINIFGIAAGMAYLHSHDILHRNLNPNNVFLDDSLYPKISGFTFSKEIPPNSQYITESCIKGDSKYLSPEFLSKLTYSKASDVYSFALLMNEIMTEEKDPESEEYKEDINEAYQDLIERCWSQDQEKRPTFDQILIELKTNPGFITSGVNKDEYFNYIKFIEESPISFDHKRPNRKIDDFIKSKSHTFHKSEYDLKSRGKQYSGDDLDLSLYELGKSIYERDKMCEYNIYEIIPKNEKKIEEEEEDKCEDDNNNDKKGLINIEKYDNEDITYSNSHELYYGQIYNKEINCFYRNEMINFNNKLKIISQINHPAILNFIGYSDVNFNNENKPMILTEYCHETLDSKFNAINPDDNEWDETKKLMCMYGIASGMSFLHSHGIIHRNLKSTSIFVDDLPKISGFDVSIEIGNENIIKDDKIKGTPAYLAPEVYLKNEYSKSSDVYSYGLVLYEIITGKKPYPRFINPNLIKEEVAFNGFRPKFTTPINEAYKNLIERCWSQDPINRPTFDQILTELRTNPDFLLDEIDKEDFFEYVEFLDEYPSSFEPAKKIKKFDEIVKTRIHTFNEFETFCGLSNMYETETNNLSFNYNFIYINNLDDRSIKDGSFYSVVKLVNRKTNEVMVKKIPNTDRESFTPSDILNFSREMAIISQLNHPSILEFIGFNSKDSIEDVPIVLVQYSSKGSLDAFLVKNAKDKNEINKYDNRKYDSNGDDISLDDIGEDDINNDDIDVDNNGIDSSDINEDDINLNDKNYNGIVLSDKNQDDIDEDDKNKDEIDADDKKQDDIDADDINKDDIDLFDLYRDNLDDCSVDLDIEEFDEKLNDTRKLIFIYGIASGMSYLHAHNIIHRDLRSANIYLDDSLHPKISGFNISKEIKNGSAEKSDKIKGTPAYLAPEVYLKNEYSKSSDVYSYSYILYEIMTGEKPFPLYYSPKHIKEEVAIKGNRPTFKEGINEAYQDLIERCWSQDQEKRPTFDQILIELKTNPGFITSGVNKDEYFNYIKFIEESPISFDQAKKIKNIDYFFKKNQINIEENISKINYRNIYELESNNILFDYDYINLNNYKKVKLIHVEKDIKTYKIEEKETGQLFLAKKVDDKACYVYKDYFYEEININLELNHPSILKFIGYSTVDFKNRPAKIFVTDFGSNGSLENALDLDEKNHSKRILNDTSRLIIIYGIAAGMSYIHSRDVIHCHLKPSNIYLDDFLFPKISNFFDIERISKKPISTINESRIVNYYDEDIYISPEKQNYHKINAASDVYAFSMIVYQIISNEKPFRELTNEILEQVYDKQARPQFKESVPECYRKLIEKCWSANPKDRPTFDEIVHHLKTNPEFITDSVNREEYQNYINFIDKFESTNNFLQLDDFFKSGNKTFRKVQIDYDQFKNPIKFNFSVDIGSLNLANYEKQKKIGSGGFGVVYKVIEKEREKVCAAKISIYEIDVCSDYTVMNLSREINIISHLNHPSILEFVGFSPTNFKNKPKPVIITEFASNGSLDDVIKSERIGCGNIEWDDTKKLINIYGIASGMAYLHKENILHRDLKPANILLDDFLYPKIADFGLSKRITEEDEIETKKKNPLTSGFKGTYVYCAPEILKRHIYTKKGDVYAFGMIVYEIITNEIPYEGFNQYQLVFKVTSGYRPKFKYSIPYAYRKLIEKCWSEDPFFRPNFSEIVDYLEKDPNFITLNVDKEEYLNYISYIKDYQQSSILLKENQQRQPCNSSSHLKVSFDIKQKIVETENETKDSNDCFLNLNKFERQSVISKSDFTKLYKFIDIETGKVYTGQMSMLKINKLSEIDIQTISDELKILDQMKHPSLLKFIGFSPVDFKNQRKPVIVTEYATNGSLDNILQIERMNKKIQGWTDTKKLINIYGIASGMSYLHSKGIIHRSLKPENIYLNEILTPKIGDFGLSTRFINSDSITYQSISEVKATPIYSAPEVLQFNEYSKSSDVYAFAFIVYEIITNEIPFNKIKNNNQIFEEVVVKQNRPEISKKIPKSYRELIEACWSMESEKRPTFDEIVYYLRSDPGFITDKIDSNDFQKYISFIDDQTKEELCQRIQEDDLVISKKSNQQCKIESQYVNESDLQDKEELISLYKCEAEKGNVEAQEFLAKKYSRENDTENIYKYLNLMIKNGNHRIPLDYAICLYNRKCYKQAFQYFTLISTINHPIAKYFIGVMKLKGEGCNQNREESYQIMKYLSDNGIDRASDFLETYFK